MVSLWLSKLLELMRIKQVPCEELNPHLPDYYSNPRFMQRLKFMMSQKHTVNCDVSMALLAKT
jgi:hypothetical protein